MTTPQPNSQKSSLSAREILQYDDKFLAVASVSALAALIILILNALRIGGSQVVFGLDGFVATAGAIIATVFCARIYRKLKANPLTERKWFLMMIGFGLWAFAELLRFVIVALAQKSTFLGWLWIAGYGPILWGLYEHYQQRQSGERLTDWQRWFVQGAIGLAAFYIIVAILVPAIFRSVFFSVSATVFAFIFAATDMVILLLVLRLVFTQQGTFGDPWWLIAIAFALKLIGEALLRHSGGNSLTAPDGHENFLMALAAFCHFIWYVLAVIGMFVYEIVLNQQSAPSDMLQVKEELTPNASALIFTDNQDNVIKVSLNYRFLTHLPDEIGTSGAPLQAVLDIPESAYEEFSTQLHQQNRVVDFVAELGHLTKGHKAWITAVASYDMQKKYNGANMVVRVFAEGTAGIMLTNEERALVESILEASGARGEESTKLLTNYFNTNYKMLAGMAAQYEGSRTGMGLTELVNRTANRNRWTIQVLNREIMVSGNVKFEDLGKMVATLLHTSRDYVSGLAGSDVVRYETERINQQMDRSTKNLIERFKLSN